MEQFIDTAIKEWGAWAIVVVGLYLLYHQNNNLNERIATMYERYIELMTNVLSSQEETRKTMEDVVNTYQTISKLNEMFMSYVQEKLRDD